MKLFVKIFILAAVLLSAALGLSGYIMITSAFENSLARETEIIMGQYQADRFSFQTTLFRTESMGIEISDKGTIILRERNDGSGYAAYSVSLRDIASLAGMEVNRMSAVYDKNRNLVFSSNSEIDLQISDNLQNDMVLQTYGQINGEYFMTVESGLNIFGDDYYFVSATSIDKIMKQKSEMLMSFTGVYIITMFISLILIILFSSLITRPINKLANVSKRISGGEYGERIYHKGNDEIGALSDSFNKMANAIENKIDELSLGIKQKEDFMASFAHELKTPLTSVIGYADMLYQKDLPRETVRESAYYIYSEGMRLEALSLKLLDLIVLGKQDFIFEEIDASEPAENAVRTIKPKADEAGVSVRLQSQQSQQVQVRAEYDLIRTLLLNLLDNAVKSGGDEVIISGGIDDSGKYYLYSVSDNGRGIPENELNRIKEAFYMVDKSRSRKQHGAGLGLALAEKIINIHGDTLTFNSQTSQGTTVTFRLKLAEERVNKNEILH